MSTKFTPKTRKPRKPTSSSSSSTIASSSKKSRSSGNSSAKRRNLKNVTEMVQLQKDIHDNRERNKQIRATTKRKSIKSSSGSSSVKKKTPKTILRTAKDEINSYFNPVNIQHNISSHFQFGDKLNYKLPKRINLGYDVNGNVIFGYKLLARNKTHGTFHNYIFSFMQEDPRGLGEHIIVAFDYKIDPSDPAPKKPSTDGLYRKLKGFRHFKKAQIAKKVSEITKKDKIRKLVHVPVQEQENLALNLELKQKPNP